MKKQSKGLPLSVLHISSALILASLCVYWNVQRPIVIESVTGDRSPLIRSVQGRVSANGPQCLTFDDSFDYLVASSSSIYLAMPSKAAGSTIQSFVSQCVGEYRSENVGPAKAFGSEEMEDRVEIFFDVFKHPKLMTSHVKTDAPLISLIEQNPRDALFVFSYREETDRLLSAIRHVIEYACLGRHRSGEIPSSEVEVDGNKCIVNEGGIVEFALKPKASEVGMGAPEVMTCRFYDAIEANFPRMVFMHYKQVDKLQKLLAKYHCPEYLDSPFHKNMSVNKTMTVYVKLQTDGEVVTVEDWFEAKRDKIEWTFDLKGGDFCQGKTRKMEDDLFACKDEILRVTRDTKF